jgi:hypothetical protein
MAQKPNTKRVTATVSAELYDQMLFWADKKGISINQYLYDALEQAIAWENQDYPLPTIEASRLTQLVDIVAGLRADVENVNHVVSDGFRSLTTLTKGDNYLLDQSDDNLA